MKWTSMKWISKTTRVFSILFVVLLVGPVFAVASGMAEVKKDWRTASHEPMGIAPKPEEHPDPIIQVYGARTWGWRGAFAVHTWISYKRANASDYITYEVIGWRAWHGGNALTRRSGAPDRRWFGSEPEMYAELAGPEVEAVIDRLELAVAAYPYATSYRTYPGPNSNTFTAMVGRELPELKLDLPPTAIGKDYLGDSTLAAASPSGTGYQLSFFGLIGIMAAAEEGLEVNVLGLTFGIDPLDLAIKLPGVGRLGP